MLEDEVLCLMVSGNGARFQKSVRKVQINPRTIAKDLVKMLEETGTRLPGAWCFLRHIGAAGFRVGCALC